MGKIVAANLKMNMTLDETKDYITKLNGLFSDLRVILFPTSIYIPYFLNKNFSLGVQNISSYDKGAYTGELSPMQVKSVGVDYAIVGHSERRNLYNETDNIINSKLKDGLKNDLKIILCIGETKEEKELNKTEEKLESQIINAFKDINDISNVIIAYEPIWSIGTSLVPTNEEIKKMVIFIKMVVKNIFDIDIPVLYGGSVNENNIKKINEINELSGVLVGGASLVPEKLNIIREVVLE